MTDEALRRLEREAGSSVAGAQTLARALLRTGRDREVGALALRVAAGLGDAGPLLDLLVPAVDELAPRKVGELHPRHLAWSADGGTLLAVTHEGPPTLWSVEVGSGEAAALASLPPAPGLGARIDRLVPTPEGGLWAWVCDGGDHRHLVPVTPAGFGPSVWRSPVAGWPSSAFHAGAAGFLGAVFNRQALRAVASPAPGERASRAIAWKVDVWGLEVDPVGATASAFNEPGGRPSLQLFERGRKAPARTIPLGQGLEDVRHAQVLAGRTVVQGPSSVRVLSRDGAELLTLERDADPSSLEWTVAAPSGRQLAAGVGQGEGTVEVLDLGTGRSRRFELQTYCGAWSPSGRELALGTKDGIVVVGPGR